MFKLDSKKINIAYLGLFLGFLTLEFCMLWWIGGPLMTPDSHSYLASVSNPLNAVGEWQPPGMPLLFWFFSQLGVLPHIVPAFLGALRGLLTTLLIRPNRWWHWLVVSAIFFAPPLLFVDLSFWSESTFIVFILFIAWLFKLNFCFGYFLLIVFIPLLSQIRYSGFFLLPAGCIALFLLLRKKRLHFRFSKVFIYVISILPMIVWMTINFGVTGHPTKMSRSAVQCKSLLATLADINFCSLRSSVGICILDSDRTFFNDKYKRSTFFRNDLQFSPNSPMIKYEKIYGTSGVCQVARDSLNELVIEHSFILIWTLMERWIWQFGKWESTEAGHPYLLLNDKLMSSSISSMMDRLLVRFQTSFFSGLLLVSSFGVLFLRAARRPEICFLIIGAWTHALGIAFINPFLSLRYMVIHQMMIAIGVALVLARIYPHGGWERRDGNTHAIDS